MNNKERYQRSFSGVRTSRDYGKGVYEMGDTQRKRARLPRLAAVCLALGLVFGAAGAVYAADVGGIQRQIEIWFRGELTDVTIEFNGQGEYRMEFQDAEGVTHSQGGGGVAYEAFGRERPLTEEELLETLNSPDVRYEDDGRVRVYYYDQVMDITELFEDGVCYVKLIHDGEELYMTVKYRDGYAASSRHYVDPGTFSTKKRPAA